MRARYCTRLPYESIGSMTDNIDIRLDAGFSTHNIYLEVALSVHHKDDKVVEQPVIYIWPSNQPMEFVASRTPPDELEYVDEFYFANDQPLRILTTPVAYFSHDADENDLESGRELLIARAIVALREAGI